MIIGFVSIIHGFFHWKLIILRISIIFIECLSLFYHSSIIVFLSLTFLFIVSEIIKCVLQIVILFTSKFFTSKEVFNVYSVFWVFLLSWFSFLPSLPPNCQLPLHFCFYFKVFLYSSLVLYRENILKDMSILKIIKALSPFL